MVKTVAEIVFMADKNVYPTYGILDAQVGDALFEDLFAKSLNPFAGQ